MPEFKNDKGESKYFSRIEVGKKRIITIDGVTWRRQPAPKQLSRRERLSNAISNIESIKEKYEGLLAEIEEMVGPAEEFTVEQLEAIYNQLLTFDTDIDISEVDELRSEIENWKSGLEGTNLESSSKYEELSECHDNLENAIYTLEGASFEEIIPYDSKLEDVKPLLESKIGEITPDDLKNQIQEFIDEIQSGLDELENVEFPGMY